MVAIGILGDAIIVTASDSLAVLIQMYCVEMRFLDILYASAHSVWVNIIRSNSAECS